MGTQATGQREPPFHVGEQLMKTITITLDKTLADLEEKEGIDFDCHYPEDWYVVHWDRSIDTDVVSATCSSGKNNNLTTFYGV
jgi:hypothetical protein